MLTEGWDANTVTHVLGVRAFGTQLLCEQVIGRALRRQSYDLNDDGLFNVEYADILGIPFDFTAKPVVAPPQPPRETIQVKAVRPERDAPRDPLPARRRLPRRAARGAARRADFNDDSVLELTPDLVGATITQNAGIIGEQVDLTLKHTADVRPSQVVFELTSHLVLTRSGATPTASRSSTSSASSSGSPGVARQLPRLQGRHLPRAAHVQEARRHGLRAHHGRDHPRATSASGPIKAVLDPYNPVGSTMHVNFNTSKTQPLGDRRRAAATSTGSSSTATGRPSSAAWSRAHPRCAPTSRTTTSGSRCPYRYGSESRTYLPDFIVLVDDGHGDDDLLHLVVEIKGYRARTRRRRSRRWRPTGCRASTTLGTYGRWAFAEFTDVYEIEADFETMVESAFNEMIDDVADADRRRGSLTMARPRTKTPKSVETLTHDEDKRKNIPTAEYQSVLRDDGAERRSASPTSGATATSTRSSSGAARTSRTGATSSSTRRRSTSRRRCTRRC